MNQVVSRTSMTGGLLHVKQLGFLPKTVIDVGAALGTFELYESFPQSHHVLIEPIAENQPYLEQICQKLPHAEYLIAAATRKTGAVTLQIAPELVHSSASLDAPAANSAESNGQIVREIAGITLDQLCQERNLQPPYLIKIDVDGNEVDVLAGAVETLKQTEYVIAEVSLFNQIHRVIDFMRSQGFVIYDILDLAHRPLDNSLWQADMAFVKETGPFRQNKSFIAEQQSDLLTQRLQTFRQFCANHIQTHYSTATSEAAFLQDLELQPTNLIVFPNWNQPEAKLLQDLTELLRQILALPDLAQTKLLVVALNRDPEQVNLALSSAAMHLLEQADLNLAEQEPDVAILTGLTLFQWQSLLPHLTARIELADNDLQAIALADAQRLPVDSVLAVV